MRHTTLALVLVLGTSLVTRAETITLNAVINGGQEVPPVVSPASGTGVFTYDDQSNTLTYAVLFTDSLLQGFESAAHIHGPAAPGETASVLFPLTSGALKLDSSGLVLDEQQESELLAGQWYVNIHSSTHPSGEIRGQILPANIPVPEPSAMLLALFGMLGLMGFRRR